MRHRQSGFALPIVLLLVILVGVGSLIVVTRTTTARQERHVQATATQAFWAVEGALEVTAHAVRQGQTPPATLRIGGQEVVVEVARDGDMWTVRARTEPNAAEVHATLRLDGARATWKRLR